MHSHLLMAYLGLIALLSLVTFVAYGWDKRQAGRGGRRVPERTLHLLSICGGWPGALVGQRNFRHKTQKTSFRLIFCATVVLHVAVVVVVVYLRHQSG
jgi:uncharacterized membrane protein YsdA (DUF1294 family)